MWDLDPTQTSYNESLEQSRSALVEPKPFGPKHLNVKVPGEGNNEALVQLAVWTAAQIKKLNALNGKLAGIAIPQVLIAGHDWKAIWGNTGYGGSTSIMGIYKTIASIWPNGVMVQKRSTEVTAEHWGFMKVTH
ncbi:hypothetical protein B0O99DRAFT_600903 [Bisporella sp. PMI_857]|nr:hypothetical protein B0O99DRAFT_600903 [Bisporella sp. PMI_857]